MSGGAGGHLRPHPTEVEEKRNIAKKMEMRYKTRAFFYAFDPTNYCDIEIFNKTKESTRVYEGLAAALRYSELPVLFFTCYDVGPNETLGVSVRWSRAILCISLICATSVRYPNECRRISKRSFRGSPDGNYT